MSEIGMMKGKLADKKRQLAEWNLRAEKHVIELRNNLDIFTEDYTTLRINTLENEFGLLKMLHEQMCRLKAEIEKLEKTLG